jgi:hypothetical protein
MSDPEIPVVGLEPRTLVFDRARQREVMWIQGLVPLPVGTEVELLDPNVSARVISIRLLGSVPNITPSVLCLDCEVPPEYWGEASGKHAPMTQQEEWDVIDDLQARRQFRLSQPRPGGDPPTEDDSGNH